MRYLLFIIFVMLSFPVAADTLRAGYFLCADEKLVDQMYTAIFNKDMPGMDYLFEHGCFESKEGVQVSVLDRTGWGASTVHIRVYGNGHTAEAYTSIAALSSFTSSEPQ